MRLPTRPRFGLIAVALVAQASAVSIAVVDAAPRRTDPPPTPVNGTPSPFPTQLHTPADPMIPPPIVAPVAVLADLDSGDVLFTKGAGARRPIASLTKIMTALLVMETARPDERVRISGDAVFGRDEYGATSTLGLRAGEVRAVDELLSGLLLGSANDAARALAIHVAGSEPAFVDRMNDRARTLGMHRTVFASATGLDDGGRSTARDLLVLAEAAYDTPGFARIVRARFAKIPAPGREPRTIQNRNALLWLYPGATGVKTGSTASAGYCLVATAQRDGRRLVAVVLGAPSEAFSDAASLLNHGFAAFERRTLVMSGQALGVVRLRGGSVPVVAGADLSALVPSDARVTFRRIVDRAVAFPPAAGEVVGTYRAAVGTLRVGDVPLVVSHVPGPIDAGAEPWWVRAAVSVGAALGRVVGAMF